jgi:hypothetical protein
MKTYVNDLHDEENVKLQNVVYYLLLFINLVLSLDIIIKSIGFGFIYGKGCYCQVYQFLSI